MLLKFLSLGLVLVLLVLFSSIFYFGVLSTLMYLVLTYFNFCKSKRQKNQKTKTRGAPTAGYNNGNHFFFLVINFSTIDYYL